MTFHVYDSEGKDVFGCRQVDDGLKSMCDEVGGRIVDDQTGNVVYPMPEPTGDITYPIPAPEMEYAVVDDNIVTVEDGEVGEVVVELEMD